MLTLKRVDKNHMLQMDTATDTTHVVNTHTHSSILTFCNNLICQDSFGSRVGRIKLVDKNWVVVTELDIPTEPAAFNSDGLYMLEADFAKKWIERNSQ